jgi:hypothetical protein
LGQIQPIWGLGLAGFVPVVEFFFGFGWDWDMVCWRIAMGFSKELGDECDGYGALGWTMDRWFRVLAMGNLGQIYGC